MKKLFLLLLIFCGLKSHSQGIVSISNWKSYSVNLVDENDDEYDDGSVEYYNSVPYPCSGGVKVHFIFTMEDHFWNSSQANPYSSNEPVNWDDIIHFQLKFQFYDPALEDWVSEIMIIEKNDEYLTYDHSSWTINTGFTNPYVRYRRTFSNPYITGLSQSGFFRYLSVQLTAVGTSPYDVNYTYYPTISAGWESVEFCTLPEDTDNDSIFDINDNCPTTFNTDQIDTDNDGVGDVCDNCVNNANANQNDVDDDGIGDACDDDDDDDGILDINDNCPLTSNTNQTDNDGDGVGNICDNCPSTDNPNQEDDDNDGVGNICDNCSNTSNSNQLDTDGDGFGNACDDDDDNDGILDVDDNCPLISNTNQEDDDNDGIGNVCDDTDGNALPNLTLEKITVTVDGTTYDTSDTGDTSVPVFKNSEFHEFDIILKNDDDGIANSSNYEIYLSTSQDAITNPDGTPVYFWRSGNAGSINPNSDETDEFSQTIFENLNGLQMQSGTDYWMIFIVDPNYDVDESNENDNDNIISVKFKFENDSGRFYLNLGANTLEFSTDDFHNSHNGTVNLKIYSLNGFIGPDENQPNNSSNNNQPLIDQFISEDQTIDVSSLSTGVYAIHINDIYLQKFSKKRR